MNRCADVISEGVRLMAYRFAMDPMKHHMHAGLKRAGDHFKVMATLEAVKAGPAVPLALAREWPLVLAAKRVLETTALEEIAKKHDDASRFDCILPEFRTLQFSNTLNRLLTRQGCRFHELLSQHGEFPIILWRILVDPEEAVPYILSLCEHKRDAYSQDFIKYYTPKGLDCKEAKGELTIIAILVQLSTVSLENGNAGIKHALTVLSTHVVLPSLDRISADRLFVKLRQKSRHLRLPPGMRKAQEQRTRVSAKQRRIRAEAKRLGRPVREKRRRGGGGRWRTFVSRKCRGAQKADFRELARLYRRLTQEEREDLDGDALVATASHRAGGSSYGKRPRDHEADVSRELKRRRALAIEAGTSDGTQHAIVPASSAVALLAWPDAVAQRKDDARSLRRLKQDREHDAASELKQWRDTSGVRSRDRLALSVPPLAPLIGSITTDRDTPSEALHLWSFPAGDEVPRTMGNLKKSNPDFTRACKLEWERNLHRIIKHSDQPPIQDPPKKKANEKPGCGDAAADGVCLCGPAGDALWAFKLWTCRQMKTSLKSTPLRDLLDNGMVVLRVLSDFADDDGELAPQGREECDRWFAIGVHFFSPYKSWMREYIWPDRFVDERGHAHLKATHRYFRLMEFVKDVYRSNSNWTARFYCYVDDQLPILTINPLHVRVSLLDVDKPAAKHATPKDPSGSSTKPLEASELLKAIDGLPDPGDDSGGDDVGSGEDGSSKENGPSDRDSSPPRSPRSDRSPSTGGDTDDGGHDPDDEAKNLFYPSDSDNAVSNKSSSSGGGDSDSSDEDSVARGPHNCV